MSTKTIVKQQHQWAPPASPPYQQPREIDNDMHHHMGIEREVLAHLFPTMDGGWKVNCRRWKAQRSCAKNSVTSEGTMFAVKMRTQQGEASGLAGNPDIWQPATAGKDSNSCSEEYNKRGRPRISGGGQNQIE